MTDACAEPWWRKTQQTQQGYDTRRVKTRPKTKFTQWTNSTNERVWTQLDTAPEKNERGTSNTEGRRRLKAYEGPRAASPKYLSKGSNEAGTQTKLIWLLVASCFMFTCPTPPRTLSTPPCPSQPSVTNCKASPKIQRKSFFFPENNLLLLLN